MNEVRITRRRITRDDVVAEIAALERKHGMTFEELTESLRVDGVLIETDEWRYWGSRRALLRMLDRGTSPP